MVNPGPNHPCRLLARPQVESLLDLDAVIAAVEAGFRHLGGSTEAPSSGVMALHPQGGGFHVKAAVFPAGADARPYLAAKLNANFPANPSTLGLPTIQGVVGLFDATNGVLLALLDSASITAFRTAAATAVAVRYLSPPGATTLALAGCGAQARLQVEMVARVRTLTRILVADRNPDARARLADELGPQLDLPVIEVEDFPAAARSADIVITCTPSIAPLLHPGDLRAGTVVAAVGADSEHKSEIHPDLLASAWVVTDSTAQCAQIGDLHHAVSAGTMGTADVYAELAQVVAGGMPAPDGAERPVIFDSTGLPFQDVVTAALLYERAVAAGIGVEFEFRG